jgi:hypothetical protein
MRYISLIWYISLILYLAYQKTWSSIPWDISRLSDKLETPTYQKCSAIILTFTTRLTLTGPRSLFVLTDVRSACAQQQWIHHYNTMQAVSHDVNKLDWNNLSSSLPVSLGCCKSTIRLEHLVIRYCRWVPHRMISGLVLLKSASISGHNPWSQCLTLTDGMPGTLLPRFF